MDDLQIKRNRLELQELIRRKAKADGDSELKAKAPETYDKICARIAELQDKLPHNNAFTNWALPLDRLPKCLLYSAALLHAASIETQAATNLQDEKRFEDAIGKWLEAWAFAIKDMEKAIDEAMKLKQKGFEEVQIDVNSLFDTARG